MSFARVYAIRSMKGVGRVMTNIDLSLFNQLLIGQKEAPRTAINQVLQQTHRGFQLSIVDFSEIAEERAKLFKEHHLLDFSWENSQAVACFLAEQPIYYKSEYMEHYSICQALFYYLRAYHPGQVSDQDILEEIERRYQKYQGDLDLLQGSFEDFPDLDLEEDE